MPENNTKETWITVEMGEGSRRNMPKSKWPKAQETSKWLIETAMKAGTPQAEAEKLYSIRIVKEYEST